MFLRNAQSGFMHKPGLSLFNDNIDNKISVRDFIRVRTLTI